MIDAQQLEYYYHRLWVYFVDHHLLGQPALILLGVLLLMTGEVAFRDWDKTAMYRLFARRSMSAKIDIVYYLIQFAGIAAFWRYCSRSESPLAERGWRISSRPN